MGRHYRHYRNYNRSRRPMEPAKPAESGFSKFIRTGSTGNSIIDTLVTQGAVLVMQAIFTPVTAPAPAQQPQIIQQTPPPVQQVPPQQEVKVEKVYVDEFGNEIDEEEMMFRRYEARMRAKRRARRPDRYYDDDDIIDVDEFYDDEPCYGLSPYRRQR